MSTIAAKALLTALAIGTLLGVLIQRSSAAEATHWSPNRPITADYTTPTNSAPRSELRLATSHASEASPSAAAYAERQVAHQEPLRTTSTPRSRSTGRMSAAVTDDGWQPSFSTPRLPGLPATTATAPRTMPSNESARPLTSTPHTAQRATAAAPRGMPMLGAANEQAIIRTAGESDASPRMPTMMLPSEPPLGVPLAQVPSGSGTPSPGITPSPMSPLGSDTDLYGSRFEHASLDVDCNAERAKLKPLNAISNNIAAEPGEFPPECDSHDAIFGGRHFATTEYTWKASNLCHKPLYFEEVHLERYGHAVRPIAQPFVSGAHFFGSVIVLPYTMGMDPPWECKYALGHYRPGDCAPYIVRPVPLSARGAVTMGIFATGAALIIP